MRIHQTAGAELKPSDPDEVRGLYLRAMDGWNRRSGEAFVAPFIADCDFIAFDGTRFRGR